MPPVGEEVGDERQDEVADGPGELHHAGRHLAVLRPRDLHGCVCAPEKQSGTGNNFSRKGLVYTDTKLLRVSTCVHVCVNCSAKSLLHARSESLFTKNVAGREEKKTDGSLDNFAHNEELVVRHQPRQEERSAIDESSYYHNSLSSESERTNKWSDF